MFRAHAPLLHLLAGGGGGRRSPQRLPASPRRHSRERSLTFAVSHHDVYLCFKIKDEIWISNPFSVGCIFAVVDSVCVSG